MNSLRFHLIKHNFFEGFSSEQLEPLLKFTTDEVYKKGQFIFTSWEEARMFYLVYNGLVSLEIPYLKNSSAIINFVYPGDIIGIDCLYEPHRWYFDARVLKETNVLSIATDSLKKIIEEDKDFGYQFVNQLIFHIRKQILDIRLILLKNSSEFKIKIFS
ncbi:MAG: cyclic nucleotide-binding domain-containing protein [Bacteroidetes bacterium]|nr:cyclic nucleotide-binding domain-containing protein [Bacteroidota bacterium]MCH8325075.1 cyclic nucleotide-binding domain-containing protein [Bacteroidota bacterium]